MQQLIIDRSKWRTGGTVLDAEDLKKYGPTHLLNEEGMMCCLGFYCKQIENVPEEKLLGVALPEEVDILNSTSILVRKKDEISNDGRGDRYINTVFTNIAVRINDDDDLSSEVREDDIAEHFKTVGVQVSFINKYI